MNADSASGPNDRALPAAVAADFNEPASHGFLRIAAATPKLRVGDPQFNALRMLELARKAADSGATLVAFPELGLSAYSCEDLFHQDALDAAVTAALGQICRASAEFDLLIVLGAPVRAGSQLFNAAIAIQGGEIIGAVPKSYLPNYREYYEKRHFRAERDRRCETIELIGASVPFAAGLIFELPGSPETAIGIEICEDLWAPIPPSTYSALAGAMVIVNLSASNATVAKADYRRLLCASQSGRSVCAYLYVSSGAGESSTDLAWEGHSLIYENGTMLAESERFADEDDLLLADVDIDRLRQDRMRITSFADCAGDHRSALSALRRVRLPGRPPSGHGPLLREVDRFPYVPHDPVLRDERCSDVFNIQTSGLAGRLAASSIERVVIGVSGGLDSTLALLVATRTMRKLGLPAENVLAYTMPGFGTSELTLSNARELMGALGVTAAELDIRPAAEQMLRDLKHPAAAGQAVYDTTYENVQAGERASHLFRLANMHSALVIGTGDLSELALGWCTYGVGDQMSHYAVNASVPKTLVRFLIAWVAASQELDERATSVLRSVLETPISPELIPQDAPPEGRAGALPAQPVHDSERIVGPYELVDFFLYHTLRFGSLPSKVAFLAHQAWGDATRGLWPDLVAQTARNQYSLAEIKHWLGVFLERFFQYSQFKRTAIPNAPKVGSGGSLSPRGDWRAPSDGQAAAWLAELESNVPSEQPPAAAGEPD